MRPRQVALACRILWIVFFLSFVTLHPDIRGEWWLFPAEETSDEVSAAEVSPEAEEGMALLESAWPAIMIGTTLLFAGAYALLVWTTGKGHNWARWTLLAFILGTTALAMQDWERSYAETPLALVADLCFTAAEAWALSLLFFGPGAAWFRSADAP